MTFFPPDPEIPEQEEAESELPRWWQAPEDELPVLLPVSEMLALTDHVAVALVGIAVYRDGIQFQVQRRLRRGGLGRTEWNELCGLFMEHMAFGAPAAVADRLRFGVVLADGEKVTDANPFFGNGDAMLEPVGHTLTRREQGGGGGGSSYTAADHLWLWSLPPAGQMELVMQWPAFGIPETRVAIDASTVPGLAAGARPYWPL